MAISPIDLMNGNLGNVLGGSTPSSAGGLSSSILDTVSGNANVPQSPSGLGSAVLGANVSNPLDLSNSILNIMSAGSADLYALGAREAAIVNLVRLSTEQLGTSLDLIT